MRAFHTIAIPHRDILEGRLTMDVFAADLYEVSEKRGPDEYKDAETFFKKTYLTQGLTNILSVVEKRLHGQGGDPIIQIQTPFGGGKTHSLIAMYHKAEEWNAKRVVLVGTALTTRETLWGIIEKQLTGKIERFAENKWSASKKEIRELLERHQPVIILMDEVLEYVTKAAGVKIADSTLSAQTIAFMQELTEAVSSLDKVCIVVTLPSSIIERYDVPAERLYKQLEKVAGRVEKIYAPVQEREIAQVVRRRLFSEIKETEAKKIVSAFMEYTEREGILPPGVQPSEYRNRFIESYPFMPEVLDILYHRWGSYPTFQRTRGVLRLLSLIIDSLKEKNRPYVSLSDFDLSSQEIRQELLKHIGPEYNSVLGQDITDTDAGSKKVDVSLGNAYRGLNLGSRAAAALFLYSFSGGHERGAALGEVKRCATTLENPASVVAEAVEQLKGRLFYLQSSGDRYFFSNQPNINRILLTKIENIKEKEITSLEQTLLKDCIQGGRFKVFIWEENPANIHDSEELKLMVLKKGDASVMENLVKNKGQTPRVYRNTIFFLYPMESERSGFVNMIRTKIAYDYIEQDKGLNLSEEQRKEIRKELKKIEGGLREAIRRVYRIVAMPHREGMKDIDLGIPTFGEDQKIDHEVYDKMRTDGEILERIVPLVIKEKYLSGRNYLPTEQLYQSALKTPGETRPARRGVIEDGIVEGVRKGIFGIGEMEGDRPICRYFKEDAPVAFSDHEILIAEEICRQQREREDITGGRGQPYQEPTGPAPVIGEGEKRTGTTVLPGKGKDRVTLRFTVPKGKVASIMGVMNFLQSKFGDIEIELIASEGNISEQDYEDKIREAFRQMGIEVEDG